MKLIIWDLDGILWTGTLSEEGIGSVNADVIQFIKTTESAGIVHSICSNSTLTLAKNQLKALGVWDLFVFPSIEYGPKASRIKSIIESCQLRATDVLFVDDNQINLNEALYFEPSLNVESDTNFISSFVLPKGKSRTALYQILEAKSADKDNVDFLQNSNINIALVENTDCLLFADRIAELVNRANVLNFSRTRFTPDTIITQLTNPVNVTNYAVFAWDKYGYYGLIGYFSIERINLVWQLNYFVFSCRTLTMKIENFVAKYIQEIMQYPVRWKYDSVDISGDYSYIQLHKFREVENYIRTQEQIEQVYNVYEAKIYAFCHSPMYWILTENTQRIDYEKVYDQHTVLASLSTERYYQGLVNFTDAPSAIVFSAYNEFKFQNWWQDAEAVTLEHMKECVNVFVDEVKKSNRKMLVLLPDIADLCIDDRLVELYKVWESNLDDQVVGITIPRETEDFRIWTRSAMYDTAQKIVAWIDTLR